MAKPKKLKSSKKHITVRSDGFFKTIMENKIAAREFLEEYLPTNFKELLDLSQIKVEKESYVEEDLKKRLSDIVYSIKTKDNKNAYVYTIVEHQSKSDYWIALRIMKYTLLLCERHQINKNKLPLIMPIVVYNGTKKYNAPLSIWELFSDPERAKILMGDSYKLIDLHSMSNDEIKQKQHLGILEFFMKNIHARDMLKIWEEFLTSFTDALLIDRTNGYIYIKKLLWYTDAKVSEDKKGELNKLILSHLPNNKGEEIMRTIADSYIEEGIQKGIEKGIEKGIIRTAINMFKEKLDINLISSVTGLPINQLIRLKDTTDFSN